MKKSIIFHPLLFFYSFDCSFNDDLRSFGELEHENIDDERMFLLSFFSFYRNFDWINNRINIRLNKFVKKQQIYIYL